MKITKHLLRKDIVKIALLCVAFLLFQVALQIANKSATLSVYKGVVVSLQYGTCLIMILVNSKKGSVVATVLMALSAISMIIIIIKGGKDATPGLFNAVFYIITIVVIARYDIRREIESKTDFVTGILNRKGIYQELNEKISRGVAFNIIYLGINNFKAINDTYGHAYGDELLRKMASCIQSNFAKKCTVARIGEAEIAVVIDANSDAQIMADKLLEKIREKQTLVVEDNKIECYIDGFAGVSNYPNDATDYESLIKYADIAMAEASANKSKQAYLFNSDMLVRINRQLKLRNLIKESLAKDYFYLVYQPQYELKGKKLRGFETLIRMNTADGEFVSPAEFIPVAEKSDLILQIDYYVLNRAMREFKDVVLQNSDLKISINVSAKNFTDKGFVEKVKAILAKNGFPAKNLEIEITEYCMVSSVDATTDNINSLRALGIQIALDDFGTGYTSLNYVASMPIDLLKIDKSLVDDIENDRKRRDFVKAVITMGQLMDCEIISEGVENDSQIDCLINDGCEYVQGFVWSRPLAYDDAVKHACEQ